jgi:hypothetical protein
MYKLCIEMCRIGSKIPRKLPRSAMGKIVNSEHRTKQLASLTS